MEKGVSEKSVSPLISICIAVLDMLPSVIDAYG